MRVVDYFIRVWVSHPIVIPSVAWESSVAQVEYSISVQSTPNVTRRQAEPKFITPRKNRCEHQLSIRATAEPPQGCETLRTKAMLRLLLCRTFAPKYVSSYLKEISDTCLAFGAKKIINFSQRISLCLRRVRLEVSSASLRTRPLFARIA